MIIIIIESIYFGWIKSKLYKGDYKMLHVEYVLRGFLPQKQMLLEKQEGFVMDSVSIQTRNNFSYFHLQNTS